MTEITQRKQGRWRKGQSGNPAGRPLGARHKATLAAEALLDGEAEALTRIAIEKALGGDAVALRLCLDRILPARKDRPVRILLPPMETVVDVTKGVATISQAVAEGEITPSEAADLAKVVDAVGAAIERTDFETRLRKLEEKGGA